MILRSFLFALQLNLASHICLLFCSCALDCAVAFSANPITAATELDENNQAIAHEYYIYIYIPVENLYLIFIISSDRGRRNKKKKIKAESYKSCLV